MDTSNNKLARLPTSQPGRVEEKKLKPFTAAQNEAKTDNTRDNS